MLTLLREHGRLRNTVFLASLSAFCVLLSVFRVLFMQSLEYLFLNWNLFLAMIPWLLTSFAVLKALRSRITVIFILVIWLLFFPNSLYILTDLIHIREMRGAPEWLDLVIVLSFAWAGICFGFISLMDIEFFLRTRFRIRERAVLLLSVGLVFIASFGVSIGRFLRWNSWDLLGNPAALLSDVVDPFTDPLSNSRFWGFTLLMGTLLNFMYFGLRIIGGKNAGAAVHPGDEKRA
jgi:uncharacterized membrane protein